MVRCELRRCERLRLRGFKLVKFCETEVQDFRLPVAGNEDVRRFYIAMNDAFPVRGFESVRNLDGSVQQRLELKGCLGLRICFRGNDIAQHSSFQQLHYNEGL